MIKSVFVFTFLENSRNHLAGIQSRQAMHESWTHFCVFVMNHLVARVTPPSDANAGAALAIFLWILYYSRFLVIVFYTQCMRNIVSELGYKP